MSAIATNRPALQISTRAAKLNIRQRRPQLTIRHKRPKMKIRKRAPAFKISRSVAHVKANRRAVVQISRRFTRMPLSNSSNFTERLVSDSVVQGSFDVESIQAQEVESSALDMIAAENESNMTRLETISLEWDRGYFEIDWSKDIMEMEWNIAASPEIYVEPYDVEIYVQNNIRRNLKRSTLALPGARVDKRI